MKHPVYTAPAKINIFLKITGRREDGYHLIASRFVRHEVLSDRMWFEKSSGEKFEVVGDFDCPPEENTVMKAYRALMRHHPDPKIPAFCKLHKVMIYKQIPAGSGMGGGSSNAATFLRMINEAAELNLPAATLMRIGAEVGADVPFFISGHKSANVTGIGEVVMGFNEPPIVLEHFTPPLHCETARVFRSYRQHFSDQMEKSRVLAKELLPLKSHEILTRFSPEALNDLYKPALKSYPELHEYTQKERFLSGSGSTFFKEVA
jgi:4-diphosphocytidyl-2-C-methyl-D-erythritol kinase